MLKLYTDQSFLTETYRRKVFPLLFDLFFVKNDALLKIYKIVESFEEADIIVMPIDYASFLKYKKALAQLLNSAKKTNKPLWIYSAGDYGFTNHIKNSYTFRLGGFNSKLNTNTFIMPSFINDPYLVQFSIDFSELHKSEKPKIGFVGHAQTGFFKFCKELINHYKISFKSGLKLLLIDNQKFYPSSIHRASFLSILSRNKVLETDFVLRNKYRAGVKTAIEKQVSTKVFYDNIFNNAYTFCIRGGGNFSVRFYETLATGRIPILINTDCKLPLENKIGWNKHCLIINEKDKNTLVDQIVYFHNSLSDEEFIALQKSNRKLWLDSLQRSSYFSEIYNQFKIH